MSTVTQNPKLIKKNKSISRFNYKLIHNNQIKEVKEGSPHDSKHKKKSRRKF